MKPKSMKTILLAALLAPGALFAQTTATTTPVGYTTQTLPPAQFSFVGITLHNSVISSGVVTDESSTSITVSGVNFETLLGIHSASSPTYILELPDGTISEVSSWTSAGVLNLPDDVTGLVTPNTTTYKLRKADTISDIFGATNSAGLKPDTDGDFQNNADLVFVIGANGAPTIVYYYNDGDSQGWFTGGGAPAENLPIVYADGFYIRRQAGSSLDLTISGEVKTASTKGILISGFNFLSSVVPVGATLGNSGLSNFIAPDTTGDFQASNVDNVLLPQSNGSFITAYYYNDGDSQGWFTGGGADATNLPIDGAFIILNRGAAKSYTLASPSFYSSL